jgi:hypothetical protein
MIRFVRSSSSCKMLIIFWWASGIYLARGSVVGWGTMLQAGRSRVRIPMRSLDFSIDLILPVALWTLGSTQPLTEMSTRNLPGGKGWPARGADNLTAIYEPIIWKMWEPRRLTTLGAFTARYRDLFTFFSNILNTMLDLLPNWKCRYATFLNITEIVL